jgi:hypothetical protein
VFIELLYCVYRIIHQIFCYYFILICTRSTGEVLRLLEKAGLKTLESKRRNLDVFNYTCDDLCPYFITYHLTQLPVLAQSDLVRAHYIVLQVGADKADDRNNFHVRQTNQILRHAIFCVAKISFSIKLNTRRRMWSRITFNFNFNPLNAELNPICHLLALLRGATIVVVSRLRVNR